MVASLFAFLSVAVPLAVVCGTATPHCDCADRKTSRTKHRVFPSFLSCEGPGFAPIWAEFRRLWIGPQGVRLRASWRGAATLEPEDEVEDGAADDDPNELVAYAEYVKDLYVSEAVFFSAGWHKEFWHLSSAGQNRAHLNLNTTQTEVSSPAAQKSDGDAGRAGQADSSFEQKAGLKVNEFYRVWTHDDVPDTPDLHRGFCLYGYVTALAICHRKLAGGHQFRNHVEQMDASGNYFLLYSLLGPHRSLDILLEASPWNVSSEDVMMTLPSQDDVPAIDVSRWDWRLTPVPEPVESPVPRSLWEDLIFNVAVVGHHAALSLEPAVSLAAAVLDGKGVPGGLGQYVVQFFGQFYACELLDRCGKDALQNVLRDWTFNKETRESHAASSDSLTVWAQFAEAVAAEPGLTGADVWICTADWVICFMLQQLSLQKLWGEKPVWHYYNMWLLGEEEAPKRWHNTLLSFARQFATASAGWNTQHLFFASAYYRLAAEASWQLGVDMPYVGVLAWYVSLHDGPGLLWRWDSPVAMESRTAPARACAVRGGFFRTVHGQLFAAMVRRFNNLPWVSEAEYPVAVDIWEGQLSSINKGAGDPWRGTTRGKVWWGDVVDYLAAVWMPHDINLATFSELYALNIPILTPALPWVSRILSELCTLGWTWFQPTNEGSLEGIGDRSFAYSPWGCDSTDRFRYWLQIGDTWTFPHVHHFTSFADLFETLLAWAADPSIPRSISDGMARFHASLASNSLGFYRTLVSVKLRPMVIDPNLPGGSSKSAIIARRIRSIRAVRKSLFPDLFEKEI